MLVELIFPIEHQGQRRFISESGSVFSKNHFAFCDLCEEELGTTDEPYVLITADNSDIHIDFHPQCALDLVYYIMKAVTDLQRINFEEIILRIPSVAKYISHTTKESWTQETIIKAIEEEDKE